MHILKKSTPPTLLQMIDLPPICNTHLQRYTDLIINDLTTIW